MLYSYPSSKLEGDCRKGERELTRSVMGSESLVIRLFCVQCKLNSTE